MTTALKCPACRRSLGSDEGAGGDHLLSSSARFQDFIEEYERDESTEYVIRVESKKDSTGTQKWQPVKFEYSKNRNETPFPRCRRRRR